MENQPESKNRSSEHFSFSLQRFVCFSKHFGVRVTQSSDGQFHYGIRLFLLQHDNHPPSHTQVNSLLCVRVITQCSVYSSSDSLILWMIMFVFTRGGLITTGGSSASFISTNNSGGNVKCAYESSRSKLILTAAVYRKYNKDTHEVQVWLSLENTSRCCI